MNQASGHVRQVVRADMVASPAPLIVAGFSSIAELVSLVADWDQRDHPGGMMGIVLGTEPFPNTNRPLGWRNARMCRPLR